MHFIEWKFNNSTEKFSFETKTFAMTFDLIRQLEKTKTISSGVVGLGEYGIVESLVCRTHV